MIASNPLGFFVFVFFLMMDGCVQSIKFFLFVFFSMIHAFLLIEHVQTICARFVGPLIAAINIFACLFDNAKLRHTFLHSTILAMLLTQAPMLVSTLLFEV